MSDLSPHHDDRPAPSRQPDRRGLLKLGAGAAAGAGVLALGTAAPAAAAVEDGRFFAMGPTRLIDTRESGGPISNGQTRLSSLLDGADYVAVCNVTVVNTTGSGYLSLYNGDLTTRPSPYSSINWQGAGKIVANLAIFQLGASGFRIYCGGIGSTDYILDWVGYFLAGSSVRTPAQRAFEARGLAAARRLAGG